MLDRGDFESNCLLLLCRLYRHGDEFANFVPSVLYLGMQSLLHI
jgi:hypothetical protein